MQSNMLKDKILTLLLVGLMLVVKTACETYPATKVFIIPVEPSMFNWTKKFSDDFSYRASLLNAPDLPKWIEYLYSKRHKSGFLYGVPPQDQKELEIIATPFIPRSISKWNVTWVQVEIIGLNTKTYETRRRVIHLNVQNKFNPATRQVHLKIDNLNVDDFFEVYRMSRLLKIFKNKLWKESYSDLYFTFLTSAVSLGARRPLRPTEGEGVVVRLGSEAEFSNTLIELENEVKPLWKRQSCPRDFKRTTVERIFRDEGFILDWCNFKLIYDSPNSAIYSKDIVHISPEIELLNEPFWSRPTKAEVARRNYTSEFALTIIVPAFIMILLVLLLSAILGIQREGTSKRKRMTTELSTSRFLSNPSRPTSTLCAFSDLNGASRSRISSPLAGSRTVVTNGMSRPTPPPYSGTMWTTVVDF